MVVIYAEKSSLAKTIAGVLHAGQRIPPKKLSGIISFSSMVRKLFSVMESDI